MLRNYFHESIINMSAVNVKMIVIELGIVFMMMKQCKYFILFIVLRWSKAPYQEAEEHLHYHILVYNCL